MITFLILCLIVGHLFKKPFHQRFDGVPNLPYFHPDDFSGLIAEPFAFHSGRYLLRGFRYHRESYDQTKLIVFFHGVGAGHFAYTTEIDYFTRQGYLVYAYDYTACGLSEGPYVDGFSGAIRDQRALFRFLDDDPLAKGKARYVVGHSWGGFLALSSLSETYDVKKVVSIAGFDSVSSLFVSMYPKLKSSLLLLKASQWLYYGKDGTVSGLELLKKTTIPVLYIQGDQDRTVSYNDNGLLFRRELEGHSNVHFLIRKDLGHQPYWTLDSERYFESISAGPKSILSLDRDLDQKIDYSRLSQDDPAVMKSIIDFLSA